MKKQIQRIGMLCLMLLTALWANAATTAKWDFKNDIPSGIQANTNYTQSEFVTYPEQSLYRDNVLVGGVFQVGQKYSFAALVKKTAAKPPWHIPPPPQR